MNNKYIYCPFDGKKYPKYIVENGVHKELDEKHFVYVLQGDTVDESLNRTAKRTEELKNLSIYYGRERERFLKENHLDLYIDMQTNQMLQQHLLDIDKQANEMEEKLVEQYCKAEDVTEELKKTNPMEWIGLRNNIIHRVREIVQHELIYVI